MATGTSIAAYIKNLENGIIALCQQAVYRSMGQIGPASQRKILEHAGVDPSNNTTRFSDLRRMGTAEVVGEIEEDGNMRELWAVVDKVFDKRDKDLIIANELIEAEARLTKLKEAVIGEEDYIEATKDLINRRADAKAKGIKLPEKRRNRKKANAKLDEEQTN